MHVSTFRRCSAQHKSVLDYSLFYPKKDLFLNKKIQNSIEKYLCNWPDGYPWIYKNWLPTMFVYWLFVQPRKPNRWLWNGLYKFSYYEGVKNIAKICPWMVIIYRKITISNAWGIDPSWQLWIRDRSYMWYITTTKLTCINAHVNKTTLNDEMTYLKNAQEMCRLNLYPRYRSKTPSFPSTNPLLSSINLHRYRYYNTKFQYSEYIEKSLPVNKITTRKYHIHGQTFGKIRLTSRSIDWLQYYPLLCHGSMSYHHW